MRNEKGMDITMKIKFKGTEMSLGGTQLQVGDKMPNFTLTNDKLESVSSKELSGLRVFLTVPSLDTGVCDLEVRNFNKKASAFSNIRIYAVSLDLPFAQARWCGANSIGVVKTLSDYKDKSFGHATGTIINELGLLTRAVFIVDDSNKIIYTEYVAEITKHPDYDAIYAILARISD